MTNPQCCENGAPGGPACDRCMLLHGPSQGASLLRPPSSVPEVRGVESPARRGFPFRNPAVTTPARLLGCPFCGGPAEGHAENDFAWFVICVNRECPVRPVTGNYPDGATAKRAWNTRAPFLPCLGPIAPLGYCCLPHGHAGDCALERKTPPETAWLAREIASMARRCDGPNCDMAQGHAGPHVNFAIGVDPHAKDR